MTYEEFFAFSSSEAEELVPGALMECASDVRVQVGPHAWILITFDTQYHKRVVTPCTSGSPEYAVSSCISQLVKDVVLMCGQETIHMGVEI